MSLKNRLGAFLLFVGFIACFVFSASLFTPNRNINFGALVIAVLALVFGARWSRARRAAPPPAAAAKTAPPPAPKPAAPKRPGLLATVLKGPPKKAPPPPPPPPPPPKRKGLAALFRPKPKKKR